MNIGFFTDCYTPQVDGVVRSILLFKKSLEALGHRVFVFAPKKVKSEVEFAQNSAADEKNVFRFQAINSVFIPGYPVAFPLSLKTSYKISKLNLDIVHSHTPIMIGMLGNIVALSENIPNVFTYHTYYSEYAKHYWPIETFKNATSKMVEKFELFYCHRVNRVITPSLKLKEVLEKSGVKNEISVLPTGIDLNEFKSGNGHRFRKKWRIEKTKKILLYVGRLGEEKNLEFLLEVVKQINDKEIILVIVGDGKNRPDLEKKAVAFGIKGNVLFCGFLERGQTIDAFLASDIFVFASRTDTQGLVLGEAAAAGKPVVMLRDKGLTNVVRNGFNGFEVEENARAFGEKILRLLKDDILCAKMSKNSKNIVFDFSIDKQAKKLEKLYLQIMADYEASSWRRRMWRELNKEYKIRNWLKEIIK